MLQLAAPKRLSAAASLMLVAALFAGCGKTVSRQATEQLLASDAVDKSISRIDFRSLEGKKVFFDVTHIKDPKSVSIGFVNADYIVSALRQQMLAAGCRLQDDIENADYIVEARVGTLGTDGHEIIYGIPANNMLGTVSSFVPTAPQIPAVPEISLAKKDNQLAAAKIGVFAYNRVTKQPVWQSGISKAMSTSQNTWLFGAGPFQSGEIYEGTQFAGRDLELPLAPKEDEEQEVALTAYDKEVNFIENRPPTEIQLSKNTFVDTANTALPVEIGKLSAVDANTGDEHTYALAPLDKAADNAFFQIEGDRLLLKAGTAIDPAVKAAYTVRVAVSDGTSTFEKDLTVIVERTQPVAEPKHLEVDESQTEEIEAPATP